MDRRNEAALRRAAALIADAEGLLITAGAGMGVDSGLPDFRGNQGFWRAYPALAEARIAFEEIANPAAFVRDPQLAWGFYGHRLELYRRTRPHPGYAILQRIAAPMLHGAFVFTSNVDGHFAAAGFAPERICECHGSIHFLQCTRDCGAPIRPAGDFRPEVDTARCRLLSPLPRCPGCGALERPNILMFGDGGWIEERTRQQQRRLEIWLGRAMPLVVLELGAGTHVPTVRWFGEMRGEPLIRINPTEAENASARGVSIELPGLTALQELAAILVADGYFDAAPQ